MISDKTTFITATIASAAAAQFRQKYCKGITENTRGCLIQLLQFEIVATHHGPPDDRLTLRIQELRHIGCDGEGMYGKPRPIIEQDGIRQFLNELKAFRVRISAKRAEAHNGDGEGSSQFEETASGIEDRESELINSQLAFATQHRSRNSAKGLLRSASGRGQVQNPEVFATAEDTSSQNSCISTEEVEQNILSMLKQAEEVKRTKSPTETLTPSIRPQDCRTKPLNHLELLALLKKRNGTGIIRPVVSNESAQRYMSNRSAISSNMSKDHGSPKVEAGKIIDVENIIEHAGNSALSISSKSPLLHNAHEYAINEANQIDSPDTLPQTISANTFGLQSHAFISQNVNRPNLPLPLAGAFCREDEEDPWHGLLHIKRKDVTIPKNQQILLERRDCWLPAEPGSRGPVANIPVPILQSLTAVVEGHTNIKSIGAVIHQGKYDCDLPSEPIEITLPQNDVLQSLDTTHEDEDLPISTEEWPPSSPPEIPKVDQLPPDSSFDVSSLNRRNVEKQAVQTDDSDMPSPIDRAFFATKQSISEVDAQAPVGFSGKSKLSGPTKRHKLQQRRERKNFYDPSLSNTDSDSDFDDCREITPEREEEVSKYNAQSRTGHTDEMNNEVERGYADLNKSLYDNGDDSKITDEQRSLENLLPVDSDEEVSPHQQGSHAQPRYNDHDGILSDITKHCSKPPEEANIVKDTEVVYSSSSELETSVPNALCEGNTTTNVTQQRSTPMDITDSRKSTLQVHRTPYTDQDHRVKTEILWEKLVVEKPAERHQEMEEVKRHRIMSDNDSISEDIIPGTYSHSNSAPKPLADHLGGHLTGNAEKNAPVFHGGWVPYVSEEASIRTRMRNGNEPAEGKRAGSVCVTKRGTEESSIKSSNFTKRRKRTKPPKVIRTEDDQMREDPATKSRQLRQEVMNNINAQSRTSALLLDEVPDKSDTKILDAASEPVLPHSTQYNRGLSASQGIRETKTTCTQTPEATSSRSGTPWRDVRATELENNPQLKSKFASPAQEISDRLSSEVVDRSIFSSFQKAYPTYRGNEKHFGAMCRKIRTLETDHRMEHKSLWDDFIIRHQIEYRAYLQECSEQADDPMSYEKFYHAKIDEPQFSKRIVTPNNLCEAISESLQIGDQLVTSAETSIRDIIDLTRDAHEPQETARPRIIEASYTGDPITRNSPSQDISPFRRISSAPRTPALQRNSPLQHNLPVQRDSPSGPRSTPQRSTPSNIATWQSPILGTPRTDEKTPRSLPWKRKIPDNVSPSDRIPKRRNLLNEALSSSEPNHIQVSAYSPARDAATSHLAYPATADPPTTGFPVAMSSRTETAEIPNIRTQRNTRKDSDVSAPPASRPLLARNTTASSRPAPPPTGPNRPTNKHTVPSSLKPPAAPAQPWYLDPVNPFKAFARADASIRSGNGNAFADEKNERRVQDTKVEIDNGVVLTKMKKIDVLAWGL